MWQDYVIACVQIWFNVCLIPTLMHPEHKPTVSTSLQTGMGVTVFVITILTLHLWFTAALMAVNGLIWYTLAWQRWRANKQTSRSRHL